MVKIEINVPHTPDELEIEACDCDCRFIIVIMVKYTNFQRADNM